MALISNQAPPVTREFLHVTSYSLAIQSPQTQTSTYTTPTRHKTTMEALRKRAASLMFVEPSKPESVGNDRASSASPTKEKSSMQEEDHEEPSLPATGRRDVSFQDSISIGTQEANSELGRPKLRYLPRQ